jgi:hypothetical protein
MLGLVVDALHSSLARGCHSAEDFATLVVESSSWHWPFAAAVAVGRGLVGCSIDHLKIHSYLRPSGMVVNYIRWEAVVGSHY